MSAGADYSHINSVIPWAVISALTGATVTYLLSRQKAKTDRILEFHKEFHSRDMTIDRNKAYIFLLRNFGSSLVGIKDESGDESYSRSVWVIVRFFQRLSVSLQFGFVDAEMTKELFGELIVWWYKMCFERGLHNTGWEVENTVNKLYEAVCDKPLRDRMRIKRWHETVARDLNSISSQNFFVDNIDAAKQKI